MTNKKVITKRGKSEETWRESKSGYRSLFENMLDGFAYCRIITDKTNKPVDFVYLRINDAFEKLTGLKRKDVIGKRVTKAIPGIKKSHPELFNIYGKVAVTGKPTKFDIYFKPLNIWFSIAVYSPQKGDFVAVFENITARKRAEKELQHAAQEWRTTFDSITDLVSIHDKDYKIVKVNKTFSEFSKMEPQKLIGKPCYEVIHGTKNPWPTCPHKQVLETKKPARKEFFEPHLGIYLRVSVSPIFNEKGEVINTVHIAEDITERKRAEEKIQNLAKFPSENPSPVMRISKDGKVLYSNDAGLSLLRNQNIEGESILPGKWKKIVRNIFKSNQIKIYEDKIGGRTYSCTFVPVREAGYVNAYYIDITEKNKAEEEKEKLLHNLGERVKELNGLYSLGKLTEQAQSLEALFQEFIKNIVPPSMQFPDKIIGKIELDGKEYQSDKREFACQLTAPIIIKGKQRGKLKIGYAEDLPFIPKFEQKLVDGYTKQLEQIIERKEIEEKEILAREQERQQFAMQLHDDLAQSLANLVLKTELVRRRLPSRREEIRKEIFDIREMERDVLAYLRELMFQLKTSQLKKLDLVSTLRRYVEDFTRNYRLPVELRLKGKSKTVSSKYAFLIFSVVREIFSNIAKHAHASRISLHLEFKPKELKIVTRDNGRGFDLKKVKQDMVFGKKLGLFSIQKRVEQLKGKLTITTGKDKGTKITFTSPYK